MRLRGPRRVQVHVHDGRGVDGDGYDECENHVRAETESSESRRCEVTPIQKMARKAAEEPNAAELKNKVQTVKKSLEVSERSQLRQAAKAAEREAKARQQTKQRAGAKTATEAENVSGRMPNEQLVIKRQLKRFRIYHR